MVIRGIVLLTLLASALISQPTDTVVFLDVGQGDAILIQDGGQQVLIDGGPGATVLEQLAKHMPAFDRTIEVLVLTHPQQDHMEGLLHVMDRYDVGFVLLPAAAAESQLFQSFVAQLIEHEIPYRFAWAGQKLVVSEVHIQILAPFDLDTARTIARSDVNNASVATRIDFNGLSLLLAGDAEQVAEQLLVANAAPELLNVDILKAGHHGSNSSTHAPLLRATSPSAAIISVGADNRFGHPHPAVLARLAGTRTLRTDEQGSISFLYDGSQWRSPCALC